ncbi:acyltransferase family protein [Stigmatella aurantiaca]|uniref:Acyltransferase 3 domain protein n=1 Tax=Stigmatella aurantiaca (strain DW4/3-1) TaxID=378806 RepID=E3FTD6_STIAD|nr:acyltransferase [Stigmatella aurantiaca]ADO68350.1 Acyltransferase 3 domain protein [Stigmatella aurantiaca DW4/3-1]
MAFIDALRGVAVLFVVAHHVGLYLNPMGYMPWAFANFDMGQFGVMVFFVCSGFVIPASLQRNTSLKDFWVRRFFRLYPLYWVSAIIATSMYVLHAVPPERPLSHQPLQELMVAEPLKTVLANTTMVPSLFGSYSLIAPYWTLELEMLFYVLVSVLAVTKLASRTVPVVLFFMALAVGGGVMAFGLEEPVPVYIAAMFSGTVLYGLHTGTLSSRTVLGVMGLSVAALATAAFFYAKGGIIWGLGSMLLAWGGPILLVTAATFLSRSLTVPSGLLWLGRISYSVYLMHLLLLVAIPPTGNIVTTILVWLAAIFLVSAVTYRLVERPAMNLGRRLTSPRGDNAPSPAPAPAS